MLNDFANTLEYMEKILDNKYIYKTIEALEIIVLYLKTNLKTNEEALNKSVILF